MEKLAHALGALFGIYFMVYPILYFGYQYLAESAGWWLIPLGFWQGMLAFMLVILAKNVIFRKAQKD